MGDTVSKVGVLPPKGSRSFGVSANVAHELAGEIFDGREYSTSDDLSFDTRKPDFDLVQPGRISGCEVQLDARMRFQESCHLGGFVGGEIVGNYMDLLARSTKGHHLVEEGDELFAGVPPGSFAVNLAGLHVESGIKRECSVSKVFESVPFGSARGQGQHRIQPVQSLDSGLFIHA